MNNQAKWLKDATMMAFFAVVALFVSPIFALGCACGQPVAALTAHTTNHACCADAAAHQEAHFAPAPVGASMSDHCQCASADTNLAFIAPHAARIFAPTLAIAPQALNWSQPLLHTRAVSYAPFAARPRAPDGAHFFGRGPPALASAKAKIPV